MTFDQLIERLRGKIPEIHPTGLSDMDGKPIHTGDIVEFYFEPGTNFGVPFHSKEEKQHSVDVVVQIDRVFYFVSPSTQGGARAWRYNQVCKVIGDIFATPELLRRDFVGLEHLNLLEV